MCECLVKMGRVVGVIFVGDSVRCVYRVVLLIFVVTCYLFRLDCSCYLL